MHNWRTAVAPPLYNGCMSHDVGSQAGSVLPGGTLTFLCCSLDPRADAGHHADGVPPMAVDGYAGRVRAAVAVHDGIVFVEGEMIGAAFPIPRDALEAALDI